MKQYRYHVYMTQEELDTGLYTYTGTVFANSKIAAENKVRDMFPDAYYFYCI